MNKVNYQKEMDGILKGLEEQNQSAPPKTLLLHSCCAPCSSYVLEYLSQYFEITVFYYNPNIYPESEYEKRVLEQQNLIAQLSTKYSIHFQEGEYIPQDFYQMAKGLEEVKEGGERCFRCYEMRLKEACMTAKELKLDYFATTLSISPLKNADKLNEIGRKLEKEYEVAYLASDFKKKNGYQRSVELSTQYGLYRQDYCGCLFSKKERERQKQIY